MSKAGKHRGRDGKAIRNVDIQGEALEVERRRYHERLRFERETNRGTERAVRDDSKEEEG